METTNYLWPEEDLLLFDFASLFPLLILLLLLLLLLTLLLVLFALLLAGGGGGLLFFGLGKSESSEVISYGDRVTSIAVKTNNDDDLTRKSESKVHGKSGS